MFNDALFNTGVFNAEPASTESRKVTLLIGQKSSIQSAKVSLLIGQESIAHGLVTLAIGQRSVASSNRASLLIGQASVAHGKATLIIGQSSQPAGVGRADIIGWSMTALIDGVDLSHRLTGAWSVDGERGLSRIAEFRLVPTSQEVDTMEYYRRPVELIFHYHTVAGDTQDFKLFTGYILEPDYDVDARLLVLRCSDLLKERLDAMTQDQLDAEIGGYFSPAIYEESMTGWERAQIMTTSQAASYDLDRHGNGVFYTWEGGGDLHAFSEGDYIAGSIDFSQANAGNIHNHTTIRFDFRFTRKRWRDYRYSWQMQPTIGCEFLNNPFMLPQRSMIQSACESTGWDLIGLSFVDLPKPQVFTCSVNGKLYSLPWGYEIINNSLVPDQDQEQLCQGFHAKFRKKWAQTVTEQYTITVQAPQSVALLGKLPQEIAAGMESEFDGDVWEAQENTTDRHMDTATWSVTGDRIRDVDDETEIDRTAMEYALKTLQAVAVGEMLKSHRQNHLSWDVLLDPTVERSHRASLVADGVESIGQIYQVVHRGDFESADAITTITVDLSRIGATAAEGAGVVPAIQVAKKPDSDLGAADPDAHGGLSAGNSTMHIGGSVTSPPFNPDWTGFMTNYGYDEFNDQPFNPDAPIAEMYPVQFVLPTPAIESELRQSIEVEADHKTVDLTIPVDRLIYT